MASVLHMSQPSETLSLSLDLSLGGLFAKYNGSFHATQGSLEASQISCSFPAEDLKGCASTLPAMGLINVQWDAPTSSLDHGDPLPSASHVCPMDHLETRSLQAQRRHAARKRRKTRIEGKLQHKKQNGDFQFTEEAMARPFSNAQYVHFLPPGNCKGGERKLFLHDEIVSYPDSTPSQWTADVSATGHDDMPGTWMQVESATGDLHSMPASMVDYMDVLNANNDVQMGMEGADPSIVDGDGGVPASGSYPSSLSSSSSGLSHIKTCVPHESRRKNKAHASFNHVDAHSHTRFWFSENAHCPEVAIPTSGSSSQLLSLCSREKINSKHKSASNDRDESCTTSSSEIGNGVARDEQGNPDTTSHMQITELHGEEQAKVQDQPAATVPIISTALPHSFTILPSPYPYGVPLPWGFSLPWFAQGMSPSANGVPMAPPSSVMQSKEVCSAAIGQYPQLYELPVSGGNMSPWFPFISTGIRASPVCKNALPISTDFKPDVKVKEGDTIGVHDMRVEAHVESDREDMGLVEQVQGEDKLIASMASGEPISEELTGPGLLVDDAKSAQEERQPGEGDTHVARDSIKPKARLFKGKNFGRWRAAFAKIVAAERQLQSLPGASKTASKKKKVVRFNSLDGPGARLSNVAARQSVTTGGKDRICSQHCVAALDHSRTKAGPNEVGLTGSCGDGRQSSCLIEGDISVNIGEKHAADNGTAHSNTTVDGDMDRHDHNAATSNLCNSTIMDNLAGIQSMTRLMKVMTHGTGLNGKTIHGIMYVTMEKQARLVCMCHGKHMSSLEFVQHSGSSDLSNPERKIVLESLHAGHYVDIAAPA